MAMKNVDHTRTKANSTQTNDFYERVHRTIKDAFDDIACRKKVYQSVEAWQIHADAPLAKNTEPRPHFAKPCSGKTPVQTFRETMHKAVAKPSARQTGQTDKALLCANSAEGATKSNRTFYSSVSLDVI